MKNTVLKKVFSLTLLTALALGLCFFVPAKEAREVKALPYVTKWNHIWPHLLQDKEIAKDEFKVDIHDQTYLNYIAPWYYKDGQYYHPSGYHVAKEAFEKWCKNSLLQKPYLHWGNWPWLYLVPQKPPVAPPTITTEVAKSQDAASPNAKQSVQVGKICVEPAVNAGHDIVPSIKIISSSDEYIKAAVIFVDKATGEAVNYDSQILVTALGFAGGKAEILTGKNSYTACGYQQNRDGNLEFIVNPSNVFVVSK